MRRAVYSLALWLALLPALAGAQDAMMIGAGSPSKAASSTATCASVLPGLVLNLDASKSASVHLSGSNVTQWDDQSGSGNNVVQATGARQQTYSATGFNGTKPGVTAVAANAQFLQNTAFPLNTTTMSIFIVLTFTGSDPLNSGLVSFVAAGQADDFGNSQSFGMVAPTGTGAAFKFVNSVYADQTNLTATTQNAPTTIGWVFDGSNGTGYLDFSGDTPAAITTTFGGTTGLLAFGTRPWNGNTPSFDGTYAEIIITTSALSSGQRSALHTCLTAKWGVP
jgi:hypothetical protein